MSKPCRLPPGPATALPEPPPESGEGILLVDDDPTVGRMYACQLGRPYRVETCTSAAEGLVRLEESGPHAVVVADLRMPGLDGSTFLAEVRRRHPDIVRIVLTSTEFVGDAVRAVNEGEVFRFLTKPCPARTLARVLKSCVEHHRAVVAEHELLSSTLSGALSLLNEVLSLVNPEALGRARRTHGLAKRLGEELAIDRAWVLSAAASLSQVGCVALSDALIRKVCEGTPLAPPERECLERHPQVARSLIERIPRLHEVARVVAHQATRFDSVPEEVRDSDLPIASRILKVVLDYDLLFERGLPPATALRRLRYRAGSYDPRVLEALGRVLDVNRENGAVALPLAGLRDGMVLEEHVRDSRGTLLVARGQEVTAPLHQRLLHYAVESWPVHEPILVRR